MYFLAMSHTAKLPVFDLAYDKDNVFRIGHDKANEQIHNYLINIFAKRWATSAFYYP